MVYKKYAVSVASVLYFIRNVLPMFNAIFHAHYKGCGF